MRFTAGREALGDAVAFVSRALPSRPVVPLLSGMLLQAEADAVTLSCFDYEVSARVRIDAEVGEPGTALVPGRLLAEITRSLPARPVEFSDDAEVVGITCGRAEFSLVCLPAGDYPRLPEVPAVVGTVDGGALAAAIAQVASSASRDDTLPMLTAVCVDVAGPVLTLAATDRYRLAAAELAFAPAEQGIRGLALVPARIMADAARSMKAGVPVSIAFDVSGGGRAGPGGPAGPAGMPAREQPHPAEGLISLESAERRLTARLIAGEFIRYRSRFPADFGCRADLPAGPMIEAVRRTSLVAERTAPIRLSFSSDHVVIEARAEGRARATEIVPAGYSGDQPAISFNPQYLLDGLAAAAAAGAAAAANPDSSAARPDTSDSEAAGGAAAGDGEGTSDVAAGGAEAGGDAGHITLEFTSSAKPALITWTRPGGSRARAADSAQDVDDAGAAAAGVPDSEHAAPEADGPGSVPAFRYLLVPLRVPERA